MWLKMRLKNEFYVKMDFPREKVFIAHACVVEKQSWENASVLTDIVLAL